MKKTVLLFYCFIVLLTLSGCLPKKKTEELPLPGGVKEPATVSVKEVPLEGRPYAILIPRSDGREVTLEVTGIVGTDTLEYELVYLAGDLDNQIQRGAGSTVDLEGVTDYEVDILFGSCSTGGACSYDKNITGGTLTLTLRDQEKLGQKYESTFHLQKGIDAKNGLTMGDDNFKLVSSKLSSSGYYLTCSTIGLFQMPESKVIAGPYGVFTSSSSQASGEVTFKLPDSHQTGKIMVWSNKKWSELKSTVSADGSFVSAPITQLGTFVVVEE